MKIDYKQLAFILDIKPVEALEKIIYVDCKIKGTITPRTCDTVKEYLFDKQKSKSVRNKTPESLEVALLEQHLNLPTLSQAIQDIKNNYLVRPASKKWILFDYPEKELKTKLATQVKIPSVLASLLKDEDVNFIEKEWHRRYGITF
jgi:hypothetical protein